MHRQSLSKCITAVSLFLARLSNLNDCREDVFLKHVDPFMLISLWWYFMIRTLRDELCSHTPHYHTRDVPLSYFMSLIYSCKMYDYKLSSYQVSRFLTAVSTCSFWITNDHQDAWEACRQSSVLHKHFNWIPPPCVCVSVCVLCRESGILHRISSIQFVSCSLSMRYGSSAAGLCRWQLSDYSGSVTFAQKKINLPLTAKANCHLRLKWAQGKGTVMILWLLLSLPVSYSQ